MGSTPFFWNWPAAYQSDIRDGQRHLLIGDFGRFVRPQKPALDPAQHELMRAKVAKVRRFDYIETGMVNSLLHFFCVPKGLHDIRMVYNGTGCGLNESVWAPHFGLPTVRHTLRSLKAGYMACDMDVGDMFLNFLLHEELKRMSGVDIATVRSSAKSDAAWEAGRPRRWERWCRNWMGLRDSPYRSIQHMIRLKFVAYGNKEDPDNPFQWDRVVYNLPGSTDYDSSKPWVMKLRRDGHLASEVYIYVDDGRATGHDAAAA